MMKKLLVSVLIFLFSMSFAQLTGDFISKQSGNWNNPSNWLVFNGSVYVDSAVYFAPSAAEYPGQTSASSNSNVIINSGHNISVITPSTFNIKDVYVKGKLTLMQNLNLPSTTSFYIDHGRLEMDSGMQLILPSGALFSMNITDPVNQGVHPLDGNKDCNNNTAVVIGTKNYTACAGQGNTEAGSFEQLNQSAVNLKSNPSVVSPEICNGENVSLNGGYIYTQNGAPPATISYLWSLVSAPAGYTFSNTILQNPNTGVLSIDGIYTFRLTVTMSDKHSYKDISITVGKSIIFTTSWSNGLPNPKLKAIINGNYNTNTNGSFEACACKVESGGSLTITEGKYVKLTNELVNLGNVTVENNANLIQVNNVQNTGNIKVNRESKMKRLDYTYWGSPVTGQSFKNFSPLTVASRFYSYNETYDSFVSVNTANNFIAGTGYAIRAPNNFSTTTSTFNGVFTGVPNNGDIPVLLAFSGSTKGRNMISNPYPSNIDLYQLHQLNPEVSGGVFYFWTNDADSGNGNVDAPVGSYGIYTKNQYAALNLMGSVPAATSADNSPKYPSQIIKPGQGFIIQASAGGVLNFTNSVRTVSDVAGGNTAVFFNRIRSNDNTMQSAIAGRYWLSLTSPLSIKNILLVGYASDADAGLESKYDAEMISAGSDSFYSLSEEKKLAIQGRPSDDWVNDIVPVGITHYNPGIYTISLEKKDGVFGNDQKIYLRDKDLGMVTDLTMQNYTYSGKDGARDDRFEILYNLKTTTLGTNNNVIVDDVVVSRIGNDYKVVSKNKITGIEVYDSSGKMVLKLQNIFNTSAVISGEQLKKGLYIIKIERDNYIIMKKLIK